MLAVTQTNLRTNINQLLENVSRNDDTLVVTRSRRENVVIISEAEYNSWQETNYLMKNEINRKTLSESFSSNNLGEGNVLTLEEWEKMNC
ncbi:type II toxin-antitoxin system Phd/YefM family antitoxin [Leuconostoc suionicum]|uniref:type II toxin-antitoxin system Phd/YefM family antitoxin n=1 Tax=Leuconostoc suionicum TaxID=1511761 RepID=UPI00233ED56A|nr:type II toxin-antitoxin system Phd/YefM family antitoxin [Leuconostoc suionicum]MDC2817346.1 type II toxin-antitoxin system Phd/YefM family antitoxin [Leuconostoc suionicum]